MRTLYFGHISPYSRKIRVALAEKQLEYKQEIIGGPDRPAGFNDINPCREVPALEDNGQAIFESNDILEYLLRTYPENGPSDDGIPFASQMCRDDHYWHDRQTLSGIETMLDSGLTLLQLRNNGITPDQSDFLKRERARIDVLLDWLEKRATSEGFLPGTFSIQDMNFLISVQWSDYRGMFEWRGRPNLEAIVARYSERPSIASTGPELAPA